MSDIGIVVPDEVRDIVKQLDAKHEEWLEQRSKDVLTPELEPDPLLEDLLKPNHLDVLSDFDRMEWNYERLRSHRTRIEGRLSWMKTDKFNLGYTYPKDQVSFHIATLHKELYYIENYQRRLKAQHKSISDSAVITRLKLLEERLEKLENVVFVSNQ